MAKEEASRVRLARQGGVSSLQLDLLTEDKQARARTLNAKVEAMKSEIENVKPESVLDYKDLAKKVQREAAVVDSI